MSNPFKDLDALTSLVRDLQPTIDMAVRQADAVRPLLEAATTLQEDLCGQVAESLKIDTSALGLAGNLKTYTESAAALGSAKELVTYTEASAAVKTGLLVDTAALDLAGDVATYTEIAAAIKTALQVDTSAFEWTKTFAPQLDAVAAIRSTLIGSGVLDQVRGFTDFTAQWRSVIDGFDKITNLLPSSAFDDINSVGASFRVAMPTLPDIDPALFGTAWNDNLADAYERLRTVAEKVANDPHAGIDDVAAVVAEVEAVKASTPPEARTTMNEHLARVTLWLLREVAKDAAKKAVYTAVAAIIILLYGFAEPTPLPSVPAPPALLSQPGAIVIPGDWQIEGLPEIIKRAGPQASRRTLEFFTAQIRNRNTRQAYANAVVRFFNWCDDRDLELGDITPFAVAAYVEEMQRDFAASTVKQHLAAIRMLFDYLVVGQILPMNPASSVRGPKHVVKTGKAPVLQSDEARLLLDSIDISDPSGLRDRALLGVMIYSFARVSAVVGMDVGDYYQQDKRWWLRLEEKGGKHHELPVHHKAEEYLDGYIAAAGIGDEKDSALWRSMTKERGYGGNRMSRVDVFRMIKRRVRDADLGAAANCHTLRATGITAYLLNGGTLQKAQTIAGHESPRTTKLYDRTSDEITLDEIEKISI